MARRMPYRSSRCVQPVLRATSLRSTEATWTASDDGADMMHKSWTPTADGLPGKEGTLSVRAQPTRSTPAHSTRLEHRLEDATLYDAAANTLQATDPPHPALSSPTLHARTLEWTEHISTPSIQSGSERDKTHTHTHRRECAHTGWPTRHTRPGRSAHSLAIHTDSLHGGGIRPSPQHTVEHYRKIAPLPRHQ